MRISVLSSDPAHPVFEYLTRWCEAMSGQHDVELRTKTSELSGGDILFLISCVEIVAPEVRRKYINSLVIHASDLPQGRGWSPLIWTILEGQNEIVVTLLEAVETVDSGDIWAQDRLVFEGHELWDELNARLFSTELELMSYAVNYIGVIRPRRQSLAPPSYFPRRTPEDSRLDPNKSIRAQFSLLRVCDPNRFPAFFDMHGYRYEVRIRKSGRSPSTGNSRGNCDASG